jgi:NAD(P)-dependent dehydrogenase (short-subunit alcohol dehydrogenase family)
MLRGVLLLAPRRTYLWLMPKLENKVAVVTGGSSGIGLAIARRFADEGAHVVVVGRRAGELDKARSLIGPRATPVIADVSNLDDLDRLYQAVGRDHGVIDIVIANAGMVEPMAIDQITPEHFDTTFGLNARGTFFSVQKALPLMTRGGAVVLVASAVQYRGFPAHATYAATKAAQRSFARTFANELKDRGIRVNSLSPGPIDTPIFDRRATSKAEADTTRATYGALVPLGRLGTVDEMAAAALFLASSDSSYSTGIDLVADGGFTQL